MIASSLGLIVFLPSLLGMQKLRDLWKTPLVNTQQLESCEQALKSCTQVTLKGLLDKLDCQIRSHLPVLNQEENDFERLSAGSEASSLFSHDSSKRCSDPSDVLFETLDCSMPESETDQLQSSLGNVDLYSDPCSSS